MWRSSSSSIQKTRGGRLRTRCPTRRPRGPLRLLPATPLRTTVPAWSGQTQPRRHGVCSPCRCPHRSAGPAVCIRRRAIARLNALLVSHACSRPLGPLLSVLPQVETMTKLAHENVVQMYTKIEEQGCTYLVMEIIGGGELFDTARSRPPPACVCALACVFVSDRESERERE